MHCLKEQYEKRAGNHSASLASTKGQYQLSKETIELINHKCHDLKHQVQAIRAVKDEKERETYLEKIEKSVQIYSAIVRTGNEILDTILTEKV